MNGPVIGSMFSGYGGLDMAVHEVFGGSVAWFAENNPDAAKVLAHNWPEIPNLGDVTAVRWDDVEPVDILTAGFPCQNISNAGDRKGITGDKSRLWNNVVDAVRVLRPPLVVLENVAAIRRRGLETVIGDLAALGYDAEWTSLRASDVGAPHQRDRWFCVAYPADADSERSRWYGRTWYVAEAQGGG